MRFLPWRSGPALLGALFYFGLVSSRTASPIRLHTISAYAGVM